MSRPVGVFGPTQRLAMLTTGALVLLVAAAAGLASWRGTVNRGSSLDEKAAPTSQLGISGVGPDGSPLAFGKEMSLEAAIKLVPFSIPRPSSDLASDSSLLHVWVQDFPTENGPHDVEVALGYKSGIIETVQPAAKSLPSTFPGIAEKLGLPSSSVLTVGGSSALLIPAGIHGANPGSIAIVIDGVEVVIYGNVQSESLQTLAASVA